MNDYRLTYLTDITAGEASSFKSLVLNANKDISGIRNISCTSLTLNGSTVDLSKLSLLPLTTNGTAEANKALITDGSYGITGLRSLTVVGSGLSKSLVIQNDTTTSSASLNIVSYYQMKQGVRGSSNSTTPNCYFWRYALGDRLLMDINGNMSIGGSTVNTSYKLDVNGALNCSSLYISGTSYDLSLIPRLSLTTLGTVEASKALVADASYIITGLRSLTVVGSGLSKSIVIQNDTTTSAASLNIVSFYQMEQGVRGSTNATTPNCYFWRYALGDRLLMDVNGNLTIGQASINTAYKLDVNGAIRGTSFIQGSTTYDLSLIPRFIADYTWYCRS